MRLVENAVHSVVVQPWTGDPDQARIRVIEWLRQTPAFRWRQDGSQPANIRRVHVPELRPDGSAVVSWQWLGPTSDVELDHGVLAIVGELPPESVLTASAPSDITQPAVPTDPGERILDEAAEGVMGAGGAIGDTASAMGSASMSAAAGLVTVLKWTAILGGVAWLLSRTGTGKER